MGNNWIIFFVLFFCKILKWEEKERRERARGRKKKKKKEKERKRKRRNGVLSWTVHYLIENETWAKP